jgi:hypothetical protein
MNKSWKEIAKENLAEVKKWPKWKQKIIISAESSSTGKFIMNEEEWRKLYENN